VNLEHFGFTPTESRAYAALLKIGPSTGYAVAHAIGVARANAYQALEGLARRGAARRSSSRPVRYAAFPPGTLVAELARTFQHNLATLEDELRSLPSATADGASETVLVSGAARLLALAGEVAGVARSELLGVYGPWVAALAPALDAARSRGASVRLVALGEPAPPGATLHAVPQDDLRGYWGGLPFALVADRRRAVCGILTSTDAGEGIATSSPGLVPFLRHLLRREVSGSSS